MIQNSLDSKRHFSINIYMKRLQYLMGNNGKTVWSECLLHTTEYCLLPQPQKGCNSKFD